MTKEKRKKLIFNVHCKVYRDDCPYPYVPGGDKGVFTAAYDIKEAIRNIEHRKDVNGKLCDVTYVIVPPYGGTKAKKTDETKANTDTVKIERSNDMNSAVQRIEQRFETNINGREIPVYMTMFKFKIENGVTRAKGILVFNTKKPKGVHFTWDSDKKMPEIEGKYVSDLEKAREVAKQVIEEAKALRKAYDAKASDKPAKSDNVQADIMEQLINKGFIPKDGEAYGIFD